MFRNEYEMTLSRYRKWLCPPVYKVKGFWFWTVMTVISCGVLVYARKNGLPIRIQSLSALILLCSVYRGFFFRAMYVDKQFRVMCMDYGKTETHSWKNTIEVDENGIRTFMDGAPMANVTWDRVQNLTLAEEYVDLEVDQAFIRLDKACFTVGDAESFLAWMDEHHPELERKEEVKQFR